MLVSDHLAVESVDDRVLSPWKAIDSAYFLDVGVPLGGVFDDDSEVDIRVFSLDLVGHFLAIGSVWILCRPSNYITAHSEIL